MTKTIRFGTALPLSGEFAYEGQAIASGYRVWTHAVNAAGGLSIDGNTHLVLLTILDSKSSLREAELAFRQLCEQDSEILLFGSYPSDANSAAFTVATSFGRPVVTASGASEVPFSCGRQNVFGLLSLAKHYLIDAVDVCLRSSDPPKTFAVISCDEPAATEDARRIIQHCIGRGLTPSVLVTDLPPGQVSFRHGADHFDEVFQYLGGNTPDLLLSAWHHRESVRATMYAASHGITPKHWAMASGPTYPHLHDCLAEMAMNADGLIEPVQWSEAATITGVDRFGTSAHFAQCIKQQFGLAATSYAAGGAACGVFYEAGIQLAGSVEPAQVCSGLTMAGRRGLETFYGPIRIDVRGVNTVKPLVTVQVRSTGKGASHRLLAPDHCGIAEEVVPFRWVRSRGH